MARGAILSDVQNRSASPANVSSHSPGHRGSPDGGLHCTGRGQIHANPDRDVAETHHHHPEALTHIHWPNRRSRDHVSTTNPSRGSTAPSPIAHRNLKMGHETCATQDRGFWKCDLFSAFVKTRSECDPAVGMQ